MKYLRFFILLCVGGIFFVSCKKIDALITAIKVVSKDENRKEIFHKQQSVPIRIEEGRLYLPVSIGNEKAYNFLFDNAASTSIFYNPNIDYLKKYEAIGKRDNVYGASGKKADYTFIL